MAKALLKRIVEREGLRRPERGHQGYDGGEAENSDVLE
jgi:hypothetical protein